MGAGPPKSLLACALQRQVLVGGVKVAAVVGTLLNVVNQGPDLLASAAPNYPGMVLNFMIPFCVSVYSGARIAMRNQNASDRRFRD